MVPQTFEIQGVEYYLDPKRLIAGASFFLPTVATPKQVHEVLSLAYADLPFKLIVSARNEYGRFGVRVWCVGPKYPKAASAPKP